MTTGRINQVYIINTNQDENFAPADITTSSNITFKSKSLHPKAKQYQSKRIIAQSRHNQPRTRSSSFQHRKINYDPHSNSSVETEQEAINRARRNTLQVVVPYACCILAPDQVRFYPNLNLSTGNIQRKTNHRRHCLAIYRPKSAQTLNYPPQHSFAPAPIERCCCTSQRQQ